MRRTAEQPLLQVATGVDVVRGAGDVADNSSGQFKSGAIKKSVAEALGALANGFMHFALLVAYRAGRHQAEIDSALPVRVSGAAIGKGRGIGAGVKTGEIMGEATVLQAGLIGGDECPAIGCPEQRPAFGRERLALFRV